MASAFINFFEKRSKYPRFKSKFGKQSLIYPQNVKLEKDKIYFPKLGWIDAVIHRPINGKVKTVTITKNCCEQYFASILFEDDKELPDNSTKGKAIGIDLGLNHFAITSDGSKFHNPKWLNKHEKNLKIKQQRLSRRKMGSQNRNKARLAVAKIQTKIARCRSDFLHKLSRRIVNENSVLVLGTCVRVRKHRPEGQVVCVENPSVHLNSIQVLADGRIPRLNVKGMVKNRNLAKAISQVGWGMFCAMLKYKAERSGKIYLEVDRFFPSSKTCNHCLNQIDSLPLDIRHWTCFGCGINHDRDVNAAKNIRVGWTSTIGVRD